MLNMYKKSGFTLVELLVVISLIGILAAISLMVINPAKMLGKARDGQRRSDIKSIQAALELYYSQNRVYPSTADNIPFGSTWTVGTVTYLTKTPQDPKNAASSWSYCYNYISSPVSYNLCAAVEDSGNKTVDALPTGCTISIPTPPNSTGYYCLTNPF